MTDFEIETGTDEEGEKFVRILSDDLEILNSFTAMSEVDQSVRKKWGPKYETAGTGCSYFSGGRETGWEWRVRKSA